MNLKSIALICQINWAVMLKICKTLFPTQDNHFKEPANHSTNHPKNNIKKKKVITQRIKKKLILNPLKIKISTTIISKSNKIKINPIKKNCKEKYTRLTNLVSKPHSYGICLPNIGVPKIPNHPNPTNIVLNKTANNKTAQKILI